MASAWLIPVSGPTIAPIELKSQSGPLVIGRHEQCQIRLPADAEQVSRAHARFSDASGRWRVSDLKSRWGTFLNGYKLDPARDFPLSEGDLILITPWTFAFSHSPTPKRGLLSQDDRQSQTLVRSIGPQNAQPVAEAHLQLLVQCAATLHSAPDEKTLAEMILDAGLKGTGLNNAAVLKPVDANGRIDVIASRFAGDAGSGATFSRSLIVAASSGQVAELSAGAGPTSQSIVAMKIQSALCVPVMLGGSAAAYLYLDSRGGRGGSLRAGASSFCVALGNIASLALANLKRLDIEKRQALMEAELSAAAAAQKWILPQRHIKAGAFTVLGESRPGQFVGGDFFDIVQLDEHRLAVALGDVSGKGISASVLMTAAQGFLHSAMKEHCDPAKAARELNAFVNPRRPENKFITLWLGVFDLQARTLQYVDAAHSYAYLFDPANACTQLCAGDGLPIGVDENMQYVSETVPLPDHGRCAIVSDGIIEQFDGPAGGAEQEQFGGEGVKRTLAACGPQVDALAALFNAVITHAQGQPLADDATGVLIHW
jgi:serine phosphatase RsbU (regulator of sigma subunit)